MVFSKRLVMKSVIVIMLLQYQRQVLSENFRFIFKRIKVIDVLRMACYIVIMQKLQTRD